MYLRDTHTFPSIKEILHFEGSRGPDGIKFKSPGHDEPWHFIDPDRPKDGELLSSIRDHQHNLHQALTVGDTTRASFEAAWLAHAVTDGLTPAHHEPYEEQRKEIQADHGMTTVKSKLVMSGASRTETLKNNWKYWGAGGLMTTHTLFEGGIAMAAKPYKFQSAVPTDQDIDDLQKNGYESTYVRLVKEIAALEMYDAFKKTGWTNKLALQTNRELMPRICKAVILAWYDCLPDSIKKEEA